MKFMGNSIFHFLTFLFHSVFFVSAKLNFVFIHQVFFSPIFNSEKNMTLIDLDMPPVYEQIIWPPVCIFL